ncbi:hypothetical protein RUND412_003844 [Rhizina undulata]
MQPTLRLLTLRRLPLHITFFSRSSCALCTNARDTLSRVWEERPFEFKEIDVMDGGGKWKDAYEFDVPVIHVAKTIGPEHNGPVSKEVKKLMHRFSEEQVKEVMEKVMDGDA